MQERLDEDGEGGQQLDDDVDQPDHFDADHVNNLEELELGLVDVVGGEEAGQGNQACLAAHAQLGRVDMSTYLHFEAFTFDTWLMKISLIPDW